MIRLAKESDATAMLDIYAPIVRDTVISFELEPPTEAAFKRRIRQTLENYPWLVMELDGIVAGYVYASEHNARKAYQWSVNASVYIHQNYRRRGIGRELYLRLFDILRLQGYYNAYAGATQPNKGSVGLHESLGFKPVGIYQAAGFKNGAWHDVGWWQLLLQERAENPVVPVPFGALPVMRVSELLKHEKG